MRTLLLSAHYFPHKILRWQDAVTMIYKETVDVLVEYDEKISSPSVTIGAPAVIRLRKSIGRMKTGIKFSRVNVYTRDSYTCQYCQKRFSPNKLSFDHVSPRMAGGKTDWFNIVTACKSCNLLKGSRTCDESGMWPHNYPTRPKSLPFSPPKLGDKLPEEWAWYCSGQYEVV